MENDLIYRSSSFLLIKHTFLREFTIIIDYQRLDVNHLFKGIKMIQPGMHLIQFILSENEIESHIISFKSKEICTFSYCKDVEQFSLDGKENISHYTFLEEIDIYLVPLRPNNLYLKWSHLLRREISFSPNNVPSFKEILERKEYLKALKRGGGEGGGGFINSEAIEEDFSKQLIYEFPSKEDICSTLHLVWIIGIPCYCWEGLREWLRLILLFTSSSSFTSSELAISNLFISIIEDHLLYDGYGDNALEELPLKERHKVCQALKTMHKRLGITFRMEGMLKKHFLIDDI